MFAFLTFGVALAPDYSCEVTPREGGGGYIALG